MKYGTISIDMTMLRKLRIIVAFKNKSIREYLENWIESEYIKVMEGSDEQTSQAKC